MQKLLKISASTFVLATALSALAMATAPRAAQATTLYSGTASDPNAIGTRDAIAIADRNRSSAIPRLRFAFRYVGQHRGCKMHIDGCPKFPKTPPTKSKTK
jgi:hypothetical protein